MDNSNNQNLTRYIHTVLAKLSASGGGGGDEPSSAKIEFVDTLPTASEDTVGIFYVIPNPDGNTGTIHITQNDGSTYSWVTVRDPETANVQYTQQTLTEAQKQQARNNIDAASLADIENLDYVTAATLPTASAETMGHVYLIGPDASNNYERYYTQQNGSSYSWVDLGSTQLDLSTYATEAEVIQLEAKVGDFILVPSLEQGAINSRTGETTTSNIRIRTADYLTGDYVVDANGGKVYVIGYSSNGTFVGASSGWKTGTFNVKVTGADKYRLFFAYNNDGAITPADYPTLNITIHAIGIIDTTKAGFARVNENVKKYVATRGATYNRNKVGNAWGVDVKLGKLFVYSYNDDSSVTIQDSTERRIDANNRFLVLTAENGIALRSVSANILPGDYILLYFDSGDTTNDIDGGALYSDYIARVIIQRKVNSATELIQFNLKKYAATRGATYTKMNNSVKIVLGSLFIFDYNANYVVSIHDSTEYTLQENSQPVARFLVVTNNNTIATRDSSNAIKPTDFVLLYFDGNSASRDIIGGALFTDYLSKFVDRTGKIHDVPKNIGVYNAVRKAMQFANLKWTPVGSTMPWNNGTFAQGVEKSGMVYSSVKEFTQFVFEDVLLETFMTAIKNPRSVLYTENVSEANSRSALGRTYHGLNCACYYGSVCSGLPTYIYGLKQNVTTYEFRTWNEMEIVEDQSAYGAELADALWKDGHIMVVVDIVRDKKGLITKIVVIQNSGQSTNTLTFTADTFDQYLATNGYLIMRYKKLFANRTYIPQTDFVTVEDETPTPYSYNTDICPNYGNKSNYNEGESVVLNLRDDYESAGFTTIEVYKDNVLLLSRAIAGQDETLTGLSYGDYKARITGTGLESAYTQFKVVDAQVTRDGDSFSLSSQNATPVYYEFCDIHGRRSHDIVGLSTHIFTDAEILAGTATPSGGVVSTGDYHYLKVHFQTDYGRVIKVIDWTA